MLEEAPFKEFLHNVFAQDLAGRVSRGLSLEGSSRSLLRKILPKESFGLIAMAARENILYVVYGSVCSAEREGP